MSILRKPIILQYMYSKTCKNRIFLRLLYAVERSSFISYHRCELYMKVPACLWWWCRITHDLRKYFLIALCLFDYTYTLPAFFYADSKQ